MSIKAKKLLEGAIDMHVHSNPHASGKKNQNSIEAAMQAQKANMGGIVLKCNFFPTGGSAYLVSQVVKNIKIFGVCFFFHTTVKIPHILRKSK